ncbi:MAG TPA: TadE/TadG family type IV pilus assembly protein [Roseiarcus sp.]|nr:TadE/TadG family type IV pilus assembly protein [Roseiarcus sp.]
MLRRWQSFVQDQCGATSLMFAAGLLTTAILTGAALDYSDGVYIRTRLQAAVDSATLAVAKQGAQDPSSYISNVAALRSIAQQFLTANGPANSTVADFHACLVTGGDCTTADGRTLEVGQFYTKGSVTYTPLLNHIAALSGPGQQNLSSSATAGANLLWPQTLTLNLIGAKGWYYKSVKLYVLPYANGAAANAYTTAATWIYQPQNLGTPSGSANVNIGSDSANGMTNLKFSQLGAGYGTLTGPTTVNLGQYADVFMVESVMQGPCPPSAPWMPKNWNSGSYTFPGSCYATQSAAQTAVNSLITQHCGSHPSSSCSSTYSPPVQESFGYNVCSESELNSGSNPAYSSYNSICHPASYNSSNTQSWQFLFVNFLPAQSYQNTNVFSTSVSSTSLFPCNQTVGHEWEDGGSIVGSSYSQALSSAQNASTLPQQDFFYTVSSACGPEPGVTASGYTSSQTTTYGAAAKLVQ